MLNCHWSLPFHNICFSLKTLRITFGLSVPKDHVQKCYPARWLSCGLSCMLTVAYFISAFEPADISFTELVWHFVWNYRREKSVKTYSFKQAVRHIPSNSWQVKKPITNKFAVWKWMSPKSRAMLVGWLKMFNGDHNRCNFEPRSHCNRWQYYYYYYIINIAKNSWKIKIILIKLIILHTLEGTIVTLWAIRQDGSFQKWRIQLEKCH